MRVHILRTIARPELIASDAPLGANVGDPVTAHNFGELSPGDGSTTTNQGRTVGPDNIQRSPQTVELHYALSSRDDNWDWWNFRIAKSTGQITVGRPLDPGSYSVTVSLDKVATSLDEDGNAKD